VSAQQTIIVVTPVVYLGASVAWKVCGAICPWPQLSYTRFH
jgi:hypothetical protein